MCLWIQRDKVWRELRQADSWTLCNLSAPCKLVPYSSSHPLISALHGLNNSAENHSSTWFSADTVLHGIWLWWGWAELQKNEKSTSTCYRGASLHIILKAGAWLCFLTVRFTSYNAAMKFFVVLDKTRLQCTAALPKPTEIKINCTALSTRHY